MIKWIETTGRSEEDAISAALFQLGLDRDDVSVEVIERAKSGFLGFGSNPAKVRVSYEVEDGSPKPMMEDLLEEISVLPGEAQTGGEKASAQGGACAVCRSCPGEGRGTTAAPVEEETILSAKPGWKSQQPRGTAGMRVSAVPRLASSRREMRCLSAAGSTNPCGQKRPRSPYLRTMRRPRRLPHSSPV